MRRSMAGALWVSEPTETASKSDDFDQPAGAAIGAGSSSWAVKNRSVYAG
ncbi:hypothetical protein [Streptomyces sp. DG1A-41]